MVDGGTNPKWYWGVQRHWYFGGSMKGSDGCYQSVDQVNSKVSQCPSWILVRLGNGYRLPQSQVSLAADNNEVGVPLWSLTQPQEFLQYT